MSNGAALSIGEIAAQAGIRTSKIRYYESVGLLPAAPRAAGRRTYDAATLDTLRLIQFAQDAGFRIDEIRHVLSGFDRRTPPSARWQQMARRKLTDVRMLIDRAQQMERILDALLTCECVSLTDCVTQCRPPVVRLTRRTRTG